MSMEKCQVCGNLVFTNDSRAKSDKRLREENAKLRELVRDMWHDGMCDCDEFIHSLGVCAKCEYGYLDRMHELGIEVES